MQLEGTIEKNMQEVWERMRTGSDSDENALINYHSIFWKRFLIILFIK